MARRAPIIAVYAAGLVQGLALVTFPAAGTVLTGTAGYGLSNTQYGGLFVPQAVAAIAASAFGVGLTRRLGQRRVFLLGLVANLLAMALLLTTAPVMNNQPLAYGVLLAATGFLGLGFGLTVPTLNTLAAAYFADAVDKAVLVLNALLGLGTALAPALIALFVGLGFWWGLPLLVVVLLVVLLLFSARLPLGIDTPARHTAAGAVDVGWPLRLRAFCAFALLYGVCETMNGNWATLYMTQELGAGATQSALALTLFWGMVTVGRVFFTATQRWVSERNLLRALPLLLALEFALTATLPPKPLLGLLVFAVAGLACSALLPLAIGFCSAEFDRPAASTTGVLIAFYQVGYGIAAFGVGPLKQHFHLNLGSFFGAAACVALALAAVAFLIAHPRPVRRAAVPQ